VNIYLFEAAIVIAAIPLGILTLALAVTGIMGAIVCVTIKIVSYLLLGPLLWIFSSMMSVKGLFVLGAILFVKLFYLYNKIQS